MITSLRLRVFAFIALISTVIGLSAVVVYNTHSEAEAYTAGVSVSTRQKAIAFELGQSLLLKLQTSKGQPISDKETHDFQMLLAKWDAAQKALTYGDDMYGTQAEQSPSLQTKIQAASPSLVRAHEATANLILNKKTWDEQSILAIIPMLNEFALAINEVTSQFNLEASSGMQTRFYFLLVLAIGGLCLLIFGYILLLKPILRKGEEAEEVKEHISEELEKAKGAKADFLSNMSHEMRTPLNGVIGMTELLQKTKLDAEQFQFVKNVKTSAIQLLDIISDIFDHSSLDSGNFEIEKNSFSLIETIEQVTDLMKPLAAQKRIELLTDIDAHLPDSIIQDERRIRQVCVQLIGNAIKWTESGEVIFKVELLNTESGFVQLKFSIKDTGVGISQESQRRLFTSFSPNESAVGTHKTGAGLGLAISKQLVDRMGGRIWMESTPNVGSIFSFTVVAETIDTIKIEDVSELKGLKVLIVDDNKTNLKILVKQLSIWGVQAIPFNSPDLVVEMIDNLNKFDLCMIDQKIPQVDGITLAEKIRDKYDSKELPIVLMTASTGQLVENAKDLYNAMLGKPVKQGKLLETILLLTKGNATQANLSMGNHQGNFNKNQLKILIAHDNDLTRAVAEKNLRLLGHECTAVSNGKDAVDTAGNGKFDLLLVDADLKGIDGIETVKRIRKISNADLMPVVIGLSDKEGREKKNLLDSGMDDLVTRAVELDEIQAKIDQWFEQY
jgi:signal transduction histidine kinase/DNA-binding response OmpR family regulator